MRFHVIVPARLQSSRLPGKPLAEIAGVPLVVRVARRAAASGAASVTVAGDDARILEACARCGVAAVATRVDHANGTERIAEACDKLGLPDAATVVDVQGDEPLIAPALVDAVAALLERHPDCAMGTAAHALEDPAEFASPNVVKVVCDAAGRALYFSRAPIPWWRDGQRAAAPGATPAMAPAGGPLPLRHIGIYAYRAAFLRRFPQLAPAPLEQIEQLEQLRALWHGERIAVHVTAERPGPGVDTPADLERVRAIIAASAASAA